MKKKILSLILCATIAILSGCNGKPENALQNGNSHSVSNEGVNDTTSNNIIETYERETMFEVIPTVKETPESDFTWMEKNGGAYIVGCKSRENSVRIPEKIEGRTVLYVDLRDSNYIEVVMPDSVLDFRLPNSTKYANFPANANGVVKGNERFGENIESVYVDDGKGSIPANAFAECETLVNVSLPGSLKMFGMQSFWKCSELKRLTIPDSVQIIDEYAFAGCKNIEKFDIPDSVISIGRCAFRDCKKLFEINLPKGLLELGEYAFDNCEGIRSLEFPGSLKAVPNIGFCYKLRNVIFNEGTLLFGGYSLFQGTGAHLSHPKDTINVKLPDSIAYIPTYGDESIMEKTPFSDFNGTKFNVEYKGQTYNSDNMDDLIQLVNESEKKTVDGMTINKGLLLKCDKDIEEAIVPEGVEAVLTKSYIWNDDISGFSLCEKLKKIVFPSTMKAFGCPMWSGMYGGCLPSSVEEVKLNEGLEIISDGAFAGAKLDKLKLPSTVRVLGGYRVFQYSDIKNLELNDGLISIGHYAFQGDATSKEFPVGYAYEGSNVSIIPDSVVRIGMCPFMTNGAITSLKIGKNVQCLERDYDISEIGCFAGCANLKYLELPDTITIDRGAFYGCTSLENLKLPDNICGGWMADDDFFGSCDNLTVEYRGKTYSGSSLENAENLIFADFLKKSDE